MALRQYNYAEGSLFESKICSRLLTFGCLFLRKTQLLNFTFIAKVYKTLQTSFKLVSLESSRTNLLSIVSEFSR
jgi:hypothetical protein